MATETVTQRNRAMLEHNRKLNTAFEEWKATEMALLVTLTPAVATAVKYAFLAGFNRGIDYGRTLHARHDA